MGVCVGAKRWVACSETIHTRMQGFQHSTAAGAKSVEDHVDTNKAKRDRGQTRLWDDHTRKKCGGVVNIMYSYGDAVRLLINRLVSIARMQAADAQTYPRSNGSCPSMTFRVFVRDSV